VLTQDPPPGTPIRRYGSVVVTWTSDEASVREPRPAVTPPLAGDER
jgi:hypothetical protein